MNESVVERQFGLKVALGVIDSKQIRSVDAKTVDEFTVNTKRQASRAAEFRTFGLEVDRDLLRAATGKANHAILGKHLTGSDALVVSRPLKFGQILEICRQSLAVFVSGAYKVEFEFIDFLSQVRDRVTIDALNAELEAELLVGGTADRLHMAPPETIDWSDVDGFAYSQHAKFVHDDLSTVEFLGQLRDPAAVTIQQTKGHHVTVVRADGSRHEQWRVYDCFIFEIQRPDGLFVLSGGAWFRADSDFVKRVSTTVKDLLCTSLSLPTCGKKETETAFTARVCAASGFGCLDRKLVKPAGARTTVEVCDLLTPTKQIVHLKPKTESGTLSYLFTQGVISAECLLGDEVFRRGAAEQLKKVAPSLIKLIPHKGFNPSEYEVVFGVISPAKANFPNSLPFFGQLAFFNASKRIKNLGFNVSILQVDKL